VFRGDGDAPSSEQSSVEISNKDGVDEGEYFGRKVHHSKGEKDDSGGSRQETRTDTKGAEEGTSRSSNPRLVLESVIGGKGLDSALGAEDLVK